jgi:GNAT superfamily N-acetyltransferase
VLDQQPTVDDGGAAPVTTPSGATVTTISRETATRVLARFDQPTTPPPILARGAFEEGRTRIGAATLTGRTDPSATLVIIVDPARRKLKIGSDLLQAPVTQAAAAALRRFVVTYASSSAAAADALFRSSPLVSARRQAQGRVTTVPFVPGPGEPQ